MSKQEFYLSSNVIHQPNVVVSSGAGVARLELAKDLEKLCTYECPEARKTPQVLIE